jgi:hypothetical protein
LIALEDFIEKVCEERPETLSPDALADVHPKPWCTRHGSGKDARIMMGLGKKVWYERQQGGEIWRRVDDGSEFDLLKLAM